MPLTPAGDSCRTARHALQCIGSARPQALVTCMAREVARFNTLQQNAQHININPHSSVMYRARPEILKILEDLIEKTQGDLVDLLVEVS